jgi:DNA-binding MarR family transcriptional regulator
MEYLLVTAAGARRCLWDELRAGRGYMLRQLVTKQQYSRVAPRISEPHLAAWRAFLGAHASCLERIDRALAAEELPPLSWYDVLWALRRAPERTLRMGELADQIVTITRSGLTRLVERIEKAGYLRRERSEADLRGMWVVLTPAGEELVRRMWPVYAEEIRRFLVDQLTAEEAKVLAEALTRMRAAAVVQDRAVAGV